jgi:N-acetylglucosamine-6-phosphate deacetylase
VRNRFDQEPFRIVTRYLALVGGKVLVPGRHLLRRELLIDGENIAETLAPNATLPPSTEELDVSGSVVAPGFVDTHVHGGRGHNFMEATPETFALISDYLAGGGVTSCLATTTSASSEDLLAVCEYTRERRNNRISGQIDFLGLHLEGPFLNPEFHGAHAKRYLRCPTLEELEALWESAGDSLKVVTLAPELTGGEFAVRFLARRGVQVSIGHAGLSYEDAREALVAGARRGTHLFNALPPIHHRVPGPVPALLEDESAYLELTVDGRHVHTSVVALAIRLAGPDRILLITDGTDVAGQPDGEYRRWEGTEVVLENGQAFTHSGSLAGSTIRLNDAVANVVQTIGVPIEHALRMASETPAQAIGELHRKGTLAPGKDADVVVLDEKLSVLVTIARGRIIYDGRN